MEQKLKKFKKEQSDAGVFNSLTLDLIREILTLVPTFHLFNNVGLVNRFFHSIVFGDMLLWKIRFQLTFPLELPTLQSEIEIPSDLLPKRSAQNELVQGESEVRRLQRYIFLKATMSYFLSPQCVQTLNSIIEEEEAQQQQHKQKSLKSLSKMLSGKKKKTKDAVSVTLHPSFAGLSCKSLCSIFIKSTDYLADRIRDPFHISFTYSLFNIGLLLLKGLGAGHAHDCPFMTGKLQQKEWVVDLGNFDVLLGNVIPDSPCSVLAAICTYLCSYMALFPMERTGDLDAVVQGGIICFLNCLGPQLPLSADLLGIFTEKYGKKYAPVLIKQFPRILDHMLLVSLTKNSETSPDDDEDEGGCPNQSYTYSRVESMLLEIVKAGESHVELRPYFHELVEKCIKEMDSPDLGIQYRALKCLTLMGETIPEVLLSKLQEICDKLLPVVQDEKLDVIHLAPACFSIFGTLNPEWFGNNMELYDRIITVAVELAINLMAKEDLLVAPLQRTVLKVLVNLANNTEMTGIDAKNTTKMIPALLSGFDANGQLTKKFQSAGEVILHLRLLSSLCYNKEAAMPFVEQVLGTILNTLKNSEAPDICNDALDCFLRVADSCNISHQEIMFTMAISMARAKELKAGFWESWVDLLEMLKPEEQVEFVMPILELFKSLSLSLEDSVEVLPMIQLLLKDQPSHSAVLSLMGPFLALLKNHSSGSALLFWADAYIKYHPHDEQQKESQILQLLTPDDFGVTLLAATCVLKKEFFQSLSDDMFQQLHIQFAHFVSQKDALAIADESETFEDFLEKISVILQHFQPRLLKFPQVITAWFSAVERKDRPELNFLEDDIADSLLEEEISRLAQATELLGFFQAEKTGSLHSLYTYWKEKLERFKDDKKREYLHSYAFGIRYCATNTTEALQILADLEEFFNQREIAFGTRENILSSALVLLTEFVEKLQPDQFRTHFGRFQEEFTSLTNSPKPSDFEEYQVMQTKLKELSPILKDKHPDLFKWTTEILNAPVWQISAEQQAKEEEDEENFFKNR